MFPFKKKQPEPETIEEALARLGFSPDKRKVIPKSVIVQKRDDLPKPKPQHPFKQELDRPERLKEYDPKRDLGRIEKIKYNIKERYNPSKHIMINMEFINGFHGSFTVIETDGGFVYRGQQYIFDHVSKYYSVTAKLWCYDFHEAFSLPIQRSIPFKEFRGKVIEQYPNIELAVNPKTLHEFIMAKIAEGIMRGAGFEAFLRRLFLVALITLIVTVVFMLMFMFKTGMFSSIKIPGLGG